MKNIAKSIRERLLNLSKAQDQNFNTLLTQYALQRLLYRLSISDFHNQFILKGAWLFVVWNNNLHRPTRGLDLLGLPAAQLRVYPVYTAVAEKFQAMVHLGELNSRIKDFYDVFVIANTQNLNSDNLHAAIQATFERRNTPITQALVFIFSDKFKNDANKTIQWQAFLKKNKLACPLTFAELVTKIELFIHPIYQQIGTGLTTTKQWEAQTWSWI